MADSQYRSNRSVAKNPTVFIGVDDPRLAWDQIGITKATIGAEIEIIGLNGVPLISGGTTPVSPGGASYEPVTVSPESDTQAVPTGVTDLVAVWSGDNIVLTFNFDTEDSQNQGVYRFLVKIRDKTNSKEYGLMAGYGYLSSFLSTSSAQQTLTILDEDIQKTGITLSKNIDQIGVATCNLYKCNDYVTADVPLYVSDFPKPVFTMTKGVDFYAVIMDEANLAIALTKNFYGIIVEENITTETIKANVSLTEGWRQATAITTNSTSVIYTPDGAHRWVRIKYVARSGNDSVYSEIADITPDPFMPVNTNPPTIFTSASIAWAGNDVKVTFAQPSSNAGTTIKVKLVPYINDIESTSLYAFYYKILAPEDTEFTIKSLDLYGQFGAYYSKFKAYITSLSAQGVESISSVVSGPITRANPLAGIYPTVGTPNVNSPSGIFRVSPISNGYVVDFDMPVGASRLEVYEKSTAWTVVPTNDDNMVYSGLSPATVIAPNNNTRYVIVRYYDQYDNTSYYSMEKTGQESGYAVTPIDIGTLSLIENPVKIATDGSIFSGIGDETQYPQVFFNKDGIFAYDASGDWTTQIINSAASSSPTFITKSAQIADWVITPTKIENTLNLISKTATGVSGQSTITVSSSTDIAVGQRVRGTGIGAGATVASISGTTITLSVPNSAAVSGTVSFKATLYTGLSGTSTYAFWAGSDTAGNSDGLANFSVTQAGSVIARKISIVGDGTNNDLINSGGGTFRVTNSGGLTASSATISGSITVNSQSYFNANVNVASGSYLISAGTGTMKIGSEGLLAINSSNTATTKIYSTPQQSTRDVTRNEAFVPKATSDVSLWSKKAVFGTDLNTGWTIADNHIYSNYIGLNGADGQQSITVLSKTSNSTQGVQLKAGTDTDYAIRVGDLAYSSTDFSVTHNGKMYAQNAEIFGKITASGGGFGSIVSGQVQHGWVIDDKGIVSTGIDARIKIGDYSIKSTNQTDFQIYDDLTGQMIMAADTAGQVTSDAKRIFLGDYSRQVEVVKSAGVWPLGSTATFDASDATGKQQYRSGGLRNMFTILEGKLTKSVSGDILEFPSAIKGDLLLEWDSSADGGDWRKIINIYIKTALGPAPVNTVSPVVSPSTGVQGVTEFSVTNGTWSNNPTFTYQWEYFFGPGDWRAAPGTSTNSTYTPTADYTTTSGSQLRCTVIGTNAAGSVPASSTAVTVTAGTGTTSSTEAPVIWYCSATGGLGGGQSQYEAYSNNTGSVCEFSATACSTSGYPAYPSIPACPSCGTPPAYTISPTCEPFTYKEIGTRCVTNIFGSCTTGASIWNSDCTWYNDYVQCD